jgi:hypothetical protein
MPRRSELTPNIHAQLRSLLVTREFEEVLIKERLFIGANSPKPDIRFPWVVGSSPTGPTRLWWR